MAGISLSRRHSLGPGRLSRRNSADILPRAANLRRYHSADDVPFVGDASGMLRRRNSADILPRVACLHRRHSADLPSVGDAGRRTQGPRWPRWSLVGAAAALAIVLWPASTALVGEEARPELSVGERHLSPLALRAGAPPQDGNFGQEQDEDYDYDYDYVDRVGSGNGDSDYDYMYTYH